MKKRRHSRRCPRTNYPNRLWRYRRRIGLSQQQVASIAGYLAPSDISRFERGERIPSLVMALKLEIIYRVPIAFLYQDLYLRLREEIRAKEEEEQHRPRCRRNAGRA
jgi:transcriptional regulator with XRE-family HTH domain